jgi:hypothetical protein
MKITHSPLTTVMVLLSLSIALLFTACASNRMTRQEKAAKQALLAQEIINALNDRHYQIDVHNATPDGWGHIIHLTSLYSVTVSGDSIISYLPFFGRAYSVPYGGGSGLNFKGVIHRYEATVTRKGEHIIYMDVESEEDTYRYIISLFENGRASISVTPRRRSHISFDGNYHQQE